MTLITVNHWQVQVKLRTFRRSLVQRSRSARDERKNLVNVVAREPMKG